MGMRLKVMTFSRSKNRSRILPNLKTSTIQISNVKVANLKEAPIPLKSNLRLGKENYMRNLAKEMVNFKVQNLWRSSMKEIKMTKTQFKKMTNSKINPISKAKKVANLRNNLK